MPKLSQRGAIHLLIIFILIAGLIATLYLVQKTQIFKPKASVSGPITPTTSFSFYSEKPGASIGDELVVQVLVHSDIAASNLFDAKISYDPQALQLSKIDTDSTFIKSWVEQYSGDPGKVSLVGAVPNPGFQTTNNDAFPVMAILHFTALKEGQTTISFDDTSAIYSNADNANILVSKDPITLSLTSGGIIPIGDTVTYSLAFNWNFIGIPLVLSQPLSAKDFLAGSQYANNKCDSIVGFEASKGGATSYFSDPNKAVLNNLNTLQAGAGYQVHCSEAVSFKLTGTYLSNNPAVIKGWNMIALPVTQKGDIAFSAASILEELPSDNKLSCDIIMHQKPGANVSASVNSSNDSDASMEVYDLNSTDPNRKINFALNRSEGYWVHCNDQTNPTPSLPPCPSNSICSSYSSSCEVNGGIKCSAGGQVPSCCISKSSLPSSAPVPALGDGNGDGKINLIDLSVLLSDFNKTSQFRIFIDLNGDGVINSFDFGLMRNLLIQKKVIKG